MKKILLVLIYTETGNELAFNLLDECLVNKNLIKIDHTSNGQTIFMLVDDGEHRENYAHAANIIFASDCEFDTRCVWVD